MKLDDLLKEYGTQYRTAKELKFTANAIKSWSKRGFIPAGSQALIQLRTNNKFKIDKELL